MRLFAAPNTLSLLTLTEDLIRASGDRLMLCITKRFNERDTFNRDKTKFPAASKPGSCGAIFKPFLPPSKARQLLRGAIKQAVVAGKFSRKRSRDEPEPRIIKQPTPPLTVGNVNNPDY